MSWEILKLTQLVCKRQLIGCQAQVGNVRNGNLDIMKQKASASQNKNKGSDQKHVPENKTASEPIPTFMHDRFLMHKVFICLINVLFFISNVLD